MMMDVNKKFMYFSGSTSADAGTISPVSCLTAIETREADSMHFYFKESLETDTLDIEVTRPTNSDPRDIMEHIVNEINFSKDAFLVVADDVESEYIHPDLTDVTSHTDGSGTKITFTKPFVVHSTGANSPGTGFSAAAYTSNTGITGLIQGEVITSIFLDIHALGLSSGTHAKDAIGIADSSNPAYFTQITQTKNGVVYAGELICVEEPVGGDTSIGVFANTSGSIAPDANASEDSNHEICAASTQTLGKRTAFTITSGGNQNDYLYLVQGGTTDAAYSAGKFIVRLFGAPTEHLSDIEP